ncbi:class I SAM-dependent methyltransferase [Candidatus Sumerlaeota bacterium]|nr:class I SAM-dependent methyltransferase [Candidatus Sumerlaeota bacterium]
MSTSKKQKIPSDYYERIGRRIQCRIGQTLRLAGRIVDLGCGNCELAQYLAKTYRQSVIGIDISDDTIPKGRHSNLDLRCICRDARHLDFIKEAGMDAVVMKFALHEMKYPQKILREAYRVLRPGGTILIVEFPKNSLAQRLWNENYFTPKQLGNMLKKAGFCEVKVRLPYRAQITWAQGWKPISNEKKKS